MKTHQLVLWGLSLTGAWMMAANTAQAQVSTRNHQGNPSPVHQASRINLSRGSGHAQHMSPVTRNHHRTGTIHRGQGFRQSAFHRVGWYIRRFGHRHHHSHFRGYGFHGHHHYRW